MDHVKHWLEQKVQFLDGASVDEQPSVRVPSLMDYVNMHQS